MHETGFCLFQVRAVDILSLAALLFLMRISLLIFLLLIFLLLMFLLWVVFYLSLFHLTCYVEFSHHHVLKLPINQAWLIFVTTEPNQIFRLQKSYSPHRKVYHLSPTNNSIVHHMPSLNTLHTASHSSRSQKTCLAARNQPQNTEDLCAKKYVKLTPTDGAFGCTECTADWALYLIWCR
jgi:hypothetical protein